MKRRKKIDKNFKSDKKVYYYDNSPGKTHKIGTRWKIEAEILEKRFDSYKLVTSEGIIVIANHKHVLPRE